MIMNKFEVIEKLIALPMTYYDSGRKSMPDLLEESGYYSLYSEIGEEDIKVALKDKPERIDYWLMWSDDKRFSSGWYFLKNSEGKPLVSYNPEDTNFEKSNFTDLASACAFFIKQELERIRKSPQVKYIERIIKRKQ